MLTAIGPNVAAMQDYTQYVPYESIVMDSVQGDTVDTCKLTVRDQLSQFTIVDEDEIALLEDQDANGWPTCNLLLNPSFEGTYVSGVAPNWSGTYNGTGGTVTFAAGVGAGIPLYGLEAQRITLSNIQNTFNAYVYQYINLPTDEFGTPLGLAQSLIAGLPYYFSLSVNYLASAVNLTAALSLTWYSQLNHGGTILRTDTHAVGTTNTGNYTRYSVAAVPPTGALSLRVAYVLTATNATNSVDVIVDGAQLEYATFGNYRPTTGLGQTALQMGTIYPTPYCDVGQPGCYVDNGVTNLPYRQLRFFGGFVRKAEPDYAGPGGAEADIAIQATEYGIMLGEAPANLIIQAGATDAAAIAQLFQYALGLGPFLTGIDYTTFVQSQGTFNGGVYPWSTVRDVLNDIANQEAAIYVVDQYRFLRYQAMLATAAPFAISSSPDFVKTFPFSQFKYAKDSTQRLTRPVVEGATILSAPQNYPAVTPANALTSTVQAALTQGNTYTSITCAATTNGTTRAGTILQLNHAGTTQNVVVASDVANGATTITVVSFIAVAAFAVNDAITTVGIQMNGGQPIVQVDSATVAGTALVIGNFNSNTYSQGYTALLDPFSGNLYYQTSPTNGQALTAVYRFQGPILIRVRSPAVEAAIKRAIHNHWKIDTIYTQQGAVDRANAELSKSQKAQPMGNVVLTSPPCPTAVPLRPSQAIAVTHGPAKLSAALFQIQKVETRPLGNGGVKYTLDIGFYHPDFIMRMQQAARDLQGQGNNVTPGSVLQDVASVQDGWAVTDGLTAALGNVGVWGGTSTWGGAFTWG